MTPPDETPFVRQVGEQEKRRLEARSAPRQSVWMGLGMIGMVGWSVVVPTLLGTALGIWLDKTYPQTFSWTLTGLLGGLLGGCRIAWHWVSQEHKQIHKHRNDHDNG